MTKFYMSGPMTGYDDLNFPAFEAATAHLRRTGLDVVSPHEVAEASSWEDCLRADLRQLRQVRAPGREETWE